MAWTWLPASMRVFELEAEPVPLADASGTLQTLLAQPSALRASVRLVDSGGATVSLGKSTASEGAPLTTLRIALDPESGPELSVDFLAHQLRPERLRTVVEAALAVLRGAATPSEALGCPPELLPASPATEGSIVAPASWPEAELLSSARRGHLRLLQPRVLQQWHSNDCGYHTLYNARLLLEVAESLRRGEVPQESVRAGFGDEAAYFRHVFSSMRSLRAKMQGDERDAVLRSCTIDKSHMQHILSDDPTLVGRLVIAETATGGLPSAEELRRRLHEAPGGVLGLALGAVTHWLAAVVAHTPNGPLLLIADSQNKPLLAGTAAHLLADEALEARFPDFAMRLRSETPRYQEAPEEDIRKVWEAGLPEWWKGAQKDPVYWRQRPVSVRKQLQEMEISAVYSFLASLEEALTGGGAGAEPLEAAL